MSMKKRERIVAQMTCDEGEKLAIKLTAVTSGFSGSSEYIRSLVTADIIARKKSDPETAWRYGQGFNKWVHLSESEREQYMNQLGPVEPSSFEHFLKNAPGAPPPKVRFHTDHELGI